MTAPPDCPFVNATPTFTIGAACLDSGGGHRCIHDCANYSLALNCYVCSGDFSDGCGTLDLKTLSYCVHSCDQC
jgi:hypothetical protein